MKKFFLLFLFLFPPSVLAHPIIYKNGWVFWGMFRENMHSIRTSYTFHPKLSLELKNQWFENIDNYRDYTFGLNYLAKRWYGEDSQANLYFSLNSGYYNARSLDGFTTQGSLIWDWESRKYYTAGRVTSFYFNQDINMQYQLRLGIAPYIAKMDTLQTWLILQAEYFQKNNKNIDLTPMLRFFYKNVLWEVGTNLKGNYFLTLMVHF